MLSPHEFAALMLIRNGPDVAELDRADLDSLVERQLVALEQIAAGHRRVQLTSHGYSFLRALERKH